MLAKNSNISIKFKDYLNKNPFSEAIPWLGGDLQTLRDTFIFDIVQAKKENKILLPINNILSEKFEGDYLLGILELPEKFDSLKGIVLITHGLGGSTKRFGLKSILNIGKTLRKHDILSSKSLKTIGKPYET